MSEKNKKDIKVVSGDGKDLNISPVYEHIKSDNIPKDTNKKKDIVVPKGSSDEKNN